MISRIPVAAAPAKFKELAASLGVSFNGRKAQDALRKQLSLALRQEHVFLFNSGRSGFFAALEELKKVSKGKEVIIPAYTAAALPIALKKAGLKPVLCDISLDDFNMDMKIASAAVSGNTLCLVGVHLFGIAQAGLEDFRRDFPGIIIIEDCCQSLGTTINGLPAGQAGDLSFYSFARGKNISVYGGGCVATNSAALSPGISGIRASIVNNSSFADVSGAVLNNFMLYFALKPFLYGLGHPLISLFKEQKPEPDFEVKGLTGFQAALAGLLLKRLEEAAAKRYSNGMKLITGLQGCSGLILPRILGHTRPSFNRLPVVFRDPQKLKIAKSALWDIGVEATRMYFNPPHRMFDLGYKPEDFPNTNYISERLLALPVHTLLREETLVKMIEVIKGVLK